MTRVKPEKSLYSGKRLVNAYTVPEIWDDIGVMGILSSLEEQTIR